MMTALVVPMDPAIPEVRRILEALAKLLTQKWEKAKTLKSVLNDKSFILFL
jgi:hypothetical protein